MLSRWLFNQSRESRFGDGIVLAFLVVQALDGGLTYIGLASVRQATEGNPLVASLMATVGLVPALASAKLVAGGFGIVLHLFGTHRLIAVLTAIYIAAAVVPWAAVIRTMS